MKLKKIIQYFIFLLITLTFNQSVYGQQKNLYHVPPLHSIKGENLVISASLIDISNPVEAILYYRTNGSESFLEVPFKNWLFMILAPGKPPSARRRFEILHSNPASTGVVVVSRSWP